MEVGHVICVLIGVAGSADMRSLGTDHALWEMLWDADMRSLGTEHALWNFLESGREADWGARLLQLLSTAGTYK